MKEGQSSHMFQAVLVPSFTQFPPPGWGEAILWGGIKTFFVLFFFLMTIFALVVIRQVRLMRQTIETPLDGILMITSWLFFGLVLITALTALFAL